MRDKTPLVLIEQAIMLLVFSLAAVLCLRAFLWADSQSARNEARDQAVLLAQTAAETLKASGGDMAEAQAWAAERLGGRLSQGLWYVCYDEDWRETGEENAVYRLEVMGEEAPAEGMWQARIWVSAERDGEPLFSLTAAWQEVSAHG